MATGFRSTSVVTTARPGTEMRVTVFVRVRNEHVLGCRRLEREEIVLDLRLVVVPCVRLTGCVFIR